MSANLPQVRAILWLRWTLAWRGWQRQSPLFGVLAVLLAGIGAAAAVVLFVLAFYLGAVLLPDREPILVLFIWDAVIGAFLAVWIIGLLMNLQMSGEALSLAKLLHMPVSPAGAFLLNYLSSQMRVSLVIFLGLMLGLAAGSTIAYGGGNAILIPLVLAAFAMITAVTHQFQSWLARVLANKRRRSTVVAVAVVALVLIANAPNLYRSVTEGSRQGDATPAVEQRQDPDRARVEGWARMANVALPPGWLALGAQGARQGQYWQAVLGMLGMLAIAAASLRRSYRKTIGAQTIDERGFDRARPAGAAAAPTTRSETPDGVHAREPARPARLPRGYITRLASRHVPDHAGAIAWAGMRLWLRAPQGKMVLLSPIMLIMLYMLLFYGGTSSDVRADVTVLSFIGLIMLQSLGLLANQFGQDRGGFRAMALVAAPPAQVLLGKNLSLAPFVLGIATLAVVVLQWIQPLGASHLIAAFLQLVIIYLLGCLLGNAFSIKAPRAMPAGSTSVPNSSTATFLAMFLFLIACLLMTLPLAVSLLLERRLQAAGWSIPVYLGFSVIELALAVYIYRRVLAVQGRLLREQYEFVLNRVTEPVD